MLSEKCLECKYCEITEEGCKGKLGETIITCDMCEENEEECCFVKK